MHTDDPTFEVKEESLSLPVKYQNFGCFGYEKNLSSCAKKDYTNFYYFYDSEVANKFVIIDCSVAPESSETTEDSYGSQEDSFDTADASSLAIALFSTFSILILIGVVAAYIVIKRKQRNEK